MSSKFYVVTMVVSDGYNPPSHETTNHESLDEAQAEFQTCLDSVGEDQSTVTLVEVDRETLVRTMLDEFEGNVDDLEYEEEE